MEAMDLTMIENIEFEEKVDIDDLVLPSKPMKMAVIEINDTKQEPIEEEKKQNAFQSDHDEGKKFKLNMEKNILELYEELDKEKSENPMMNLRQRRSIKIRQLIGEYDDHNNQMLSEIMSLKAKIVDVTEENKISMTLNAKTVNSLIKMHEKTQEALDEKTNEIANIKQQLQSVKNTNQELSQEILELKMNKNNDSVERNQEIKPFSCKYCDKSFFQVHEVKKHIKIHKFISEVNDEATEKLSSKKGDEKNLKKRKQSLQENESEESKRQCTELMCDTCKKQYTRKQDLQRHIASVHEGLKPFSCQSCDSKFPNNQNLKKHIATVHEGKKPFNWGSFKCQTCDSSFANNRNLKNHISVVHEGQKPFKCQSCKYTCAAKYNLDVHVRKYH